VYTSIEDSLANLTSQRDALATQIKNAFDAAAFSGGSISSNQAQIWIGQANNLIAQAQALS
jgi:hypothetical protein